MSDTLMSGKARKFKNVQIAREGDTIQLPKGMDFDVAIEWIKKRKQEQERVVAVAELVSGFPLDCAHALQLACQQRYGFKELRNTPSFFGEDPPPFFNVPIDHLGNAVEVFLGRFAVPNLSRDSYLETSPNGFSGMYITGQVRAKELAEVKELVKLTRELVKTRSLYRGKAIRVEWEKKVSWMGGSSEGFSEPKFMAPKPQGVKLLVNEETLEMIEASIWSVIEQTDRVRAAGVPLKRSALCEGPYGTGKTLLAAETAEIAAKNGWTFFYLKDIARLKEAYQMAAAHAPAVLFAEDLDNAMTGTHIQNHALLNVLDGIDSKGAEVMLIVTTNYPERLDQSIVRPGRLDIVIPFRAPDPKTAEELVRHYAGELLDPAADLSEVGKALDGRIPAVIREVVERSKLFAISATTMGAIQLDSTSLLKAAISMNHHLKMLDNNLPKQPKSAMEQLGAAFGENFGQKFAEYMMYSAYAARGIKGVGVMDNVVNHLEQQNGKDMKIKTLVEAQLTEK